MKLDTGKDIAITIAQADGILQMRREMRYGITKSGYWQLNEIDWSLIKNTQVPLLPTINAIKQLNLRLQGGDL